MGGMHTTSRTVTFVGPALVLLAMGSILGWALAQTPAERSSGSLAERHTALHARYAEARLRFAEARLEKAERLNATSPGLVTETDLRALRARIELLRDEVAATRDTPHGNTFAAQRRAAHLAIRLAEQDLADAHAVNGRQAGAVGAIDLRMREIRLEVARLRAEIWDDPTFLASPTDVLQMQIDQLADKVQDLLLVVENAPTIDRR
jgi:hypothetical protein